MYRSSGYVEVPAFNDEALRAPLVPQGPRRSLTAAARRRLSGAAGPRCAWPGRARPTTPTGPWTRPGQDLDHAPRVGLELVVPGLDGAEKFDHRLGGVGL